MAMCAHHPDDATATLHCANCLARIAAKLEDPALLREAFLTQFGGDVYGLDEENTERAADAAMLDPELVAATTTAALRSIAIAARFGVKLPPF